MALAPAVLVVLALSVSGCGGNDPERAGTDPIPGTKLTVYSSMPGEGPEREVGRAVERGAALAIAERRGRAGRYSVTFRPLDAGEGSESRSRSNGRRAVQDTTAVGYIGELDSQLSKITVPQQNNAGVAQIGPTNTYTGLTRGGPGAEPGDPDKYYPTGVRTFARLVPNDAVQGEALAAAARDAGCRRVRIWRSNTAYGQGLADGVESVAGPTGIEVAGTEEVKPQQPSYARQAEAIDADCLVWTGEPQTSGVQVLNDAAEGNAALRMFAGNAHCTAGALDATGGISSAAAERLRCTLPVVEPESGPGADLLERYRERHGDGGVEDAYALYGYEAMAVLLDAIERAGRDGTISRAEVSEAVYELGNRNGPLGQYAIDSEGDVETATFGLYRIVRGELELEKTVEPAG